MPSPDSRPGAGATDWTPLHEAILAHDPNARRLRLLLEIEGWIVQPWDAALAACSAAAPTLNQAREVNALLNLAVGALRRDLGIADGPAGAERFQALAAAYQDGSLQPEGRRLWERANIAFGLWLTQRQQDPAVAVLPEPTPQETAGRAALDALTVRQRPLQAHAVPGAATPERMEALEALVREFRAAVAAAPAGTSLHADTSFFAAHATYALARGWRMLCRGERAAAFFAEAATLFEQGDRPDDALESARQARELGWMVDGDIAAASADDLRQLVEGALAPLARARAQARLCALARATNDLFDAEAWADRAIASLVQAGFADPQASTLDGWIDAACAPSPTSPLRLLLEVGDLYQALLGARHARRVAVDPAQASAIEAALASLQAFLVEVTDQPRLARREVVAGLVRYMPDLRVEGDPPVDIAAAMARLRGLSERLAAIKDEANVADAARDVAALRALAARAAEAVTDARATLLSPTIGLACQVEAYVLLRAGEPDAAAASALLGETLLLDGLALGPDELASHPQFDLLLELRRVRLQALLMQGDDAALHAMATDCMRAVEARRWRVVDPYQQGAFLAGRTFFHEMAALAAFRLQRWDDLVAAMELTKARAAFLDRLAPARAAADPALAARLEAANAQLQALAPGSAAREAAVEQRRALLGLIVGDGRVPASAGTVPLPSLAALQASLDADEAVVAWTWVSTSVAIVLAFDGRRVHAERIALDAEALARLDEQVVLVQRKAFTVKRFDALVTGLADTFLPPATRAFIAPARRLVLSPHRALHLLPFHVAVIDGRFLIEHAAVRYAPNLSSLLLPARAAPPAGERASLLSLGIGLFATPGWEDSPLAQAEGEARAVAEVWSARGAEVDLLLGPEASRTALLAQVARRPDRRCVHLATHGSGVFEASAVDDPFAAHLVLQDATVDAMTILQWRLDADVVVLAACDTGQRAIGGRGLAELPGDDLFGVQAALFEAGARAIVAAAWPVDDEVAPLLMGRLHDGLARGEPVDLALQAAMKDYLAQPDAQRRLYFWAPLFVTTLGRPAGDPSRETQRA